MLWNDGSDINASWLLLSEFHGISYLVFHCIWVDLQVIISKVLNTYVFFGLFFISHFMWLHLVIETENPKFSYIIEYLLFYVCCLNLTAVMVPSSSEVITCQLGDWYGCRLVHLCIWASFISRLKFIHIISKGAS